MGHSYRVRRLSHIAVLHLPGQDRRDIGRSKIVHPLCRLAMKLMSPQVVRSWLVHVDTADKFVVSCPYSIRVE